MATTSEKVEKIVKIVREETQADIVKKISSEFCIPVDEILRKIQNDAETKSNVCNIGYAFCSWRSGEKFRNFRL